MLAILASLAFAGTGGLALIAIAATTHGQWAAIRKVLADAKTFEEMDSLELDRAFLARLTQFASASPAEQGVLAEQVGSAELSPTRRTPTRSVRRGAVRPLTPELRRPERRHAAA